ncbi:putative dna repair and transcription factor protein [Botrytis fragariae]|uniref:Putative dna repair and transcription factor protein n=1 Tax=Botrytis fragariae TaxID=1964551 RepID=A0A8H6ANU8_9HELO|nr:putative dna repair and transcription factor protein [Botrytis fragariae]KAF5871178.1 putative dna repair and transcription factor protein [Botrytis fragariae]
MTNKHPFPTSTRRYQALLSRDPLAHSSFIYSVITTKIYCRPTCPSRLARRANIIFHETAEEAQKDGFRACKRCRPDIDETRAKNVADGGLKPNNSASMIVKIVPKTDDLGEMGRGRRMVDQAMKMIESELVNGDQKWTIKRMAKEVGLTESHFCRVFKRETGGTLGEYRMKVIGQQSVEMSQGNVTTDDWNMPADTDLSFNWDSSWDQIGDMSTPDTIIPSFGLHPTSVSDIHSDDGMQFLNLECCED